MKWRGYNEDSMVIRLRATHINLFWEFEFVG